MTATSQPESKSPSRRAVLAAAAGAAAAFAARAIAGPTKVEAADTGPINIGGTYADVQAQTTLGNQADDGIVLWVASNNDSGHGGGTALVGYSDHGIGVQGLSYSSATGIRGESFSGDGVRGISGSGSGVYGTSQFVSGVYGSSTSGHGVNGSSSGTSPYAGVNGSSTLGDGVDGTSSFGVGVKGLSTSGDGVRGSSASGDGVRGSSASGSGVRGSSSSFSGVYGESNATNHPASVGLSVGNSTGVQGISGGFPPAAKAKTGLYGYAAQDSAARGVIGETTSGHGIHGIATTGFAGYFAGKVYTSKFVEMTEISAPAAPGANQARLFLKVSGSGKTQLCVRFQSGAVQVIKTEP